MLINQRFKCNVIGALSLLDLQVPGIPTNPGFNVEQVFIAATTLHVLRVDPECMRRARSIFPHILRSWKFYCKQYFYRVFFKMIDYVD